MQQRSARRAPNARKIARYRGSGDPQEVPDIPATTDLSLCWEEEEWDVAYVCAGRERDNLKGAC